MSFKAQIRTDATGNITVHLEGSLDYETSAPFRKELSDLVDDNPHSHITFDMHGLDFVGSSGIGVFVQTIKSFNKRKDQIRLMNVKSEFLKVFKLYDMSAMEAIIHDFETDETETMNTTFGNRRNTFQN